MWRAYRTYCSSTSDQNITFCESKWLRITLGTISSSRSLLHRTPSPDTYANRPTFSAVVFWSALAL